MSTLLYPCLWFDGEAREAADFYGTLFPNTRVTLDNGMVVMFEVDGRRIMGLNGGPLYKKNDAISLFAYCGGDEAYIDRLYAGLMDGGTALMPLGSYPWTSKYAWVRDRFGVSWQLDIDPINSDQHIVPAMLFVNEKQNLIQEARDFYLGIFPDSKPLMESPYDAYMGKPSGTLLFAQYKLRNTVMNAMSRHMVHDFDFNPGVSIVIECETQKEIDHFWESLGRDGRFDRCGWLSDKYGVSWQIIPSKLGALMSNPKTAPHVGEVLLSMNKIEIQPLLEAAALGME
ncbi:MAG TPA: hypothetical protein DCE78_03640 [Bacteroidetes bacterium]|nr:hypothetical protein [Bacteroidota bacterium]